MLAGYLVWYTGLLAVHRGVEQDRGWDSCGAAGRRRTLGEGRLGIVILPLRIFLHDCVKSGAGQKPF